MKEPKSKMRLDAIANIFLIAFSLAAGVLASEALTRIFAPQFTPRNRYLQYEYFKVDDGNERERVFLRNSQQSQISNSGEFNVSIKANSLGFRDEDFSQDTTFDYIAMGDSFAAGWGVAIENTAVNLLEKKCNLSIANLAIPGADLHNHLNLLSYAQANRISGKKALIFITMENDIFPYSFTKESNSYVAKQSYAQTNLFASMMLRAKESLVYRSSLYNFISALIRSHSTTNRLAENVGLAASKNKINEYIKPEASALKSVALVLKELDSRIESSFILIPARHLWAKDKSVRDAFRNQHFQLAKYLESQEIDFIDLFSRFDETEKRLNLHYPIDGHWNNYGHKEAFDAIASTLKSVSCNQYTD